MFRAARMKRADVLVLQRDLEAVTAELGRLGLIHLEEARLPAAEVGGEEAPPLAHREPTAEIERLEGILARIDSLAQRLGVPREDLDETDFSLPVDLEAVSGEVGQLERVADGLLTERDRAAAEERRLLDLINGLQPFEEAEVPVDRVKGLEFLHFAVGTLPADQLPELRRRVRDEVVLVPLGRTEEGGRRLMAISSRKGRWALRTTLEESGFEPTTPPSGSVPDPRRAAHALRERLHSVRGEIARLDSRLADLRRRARPLLNRYARLLDVYRNVLRAQGKFGRTAAAALISGWVPSTQADLLRRRVERVAGGRAVVQFRDPEELGPLEEEPPVKFQHHPFFRPFEVLVSGYGTPTYTEVEPTVFVAVTYLVMFGLMFGDVGQGLVLAGLGWFIWRRARKEAMRQIGGVMGYAGLSGAAFGLFYNSVFGREGVLPWRPVLAPLGEGRYAQVLLGITLGFGILVITLGMVLNIINRLSRGDLLGGVLDRFGLVGMVIYWGAIGLGLKALAFGGVVRGWEVGLFIGLPFVVLFFKEPIYALITRRRKLYREGLVMGLMEAGLEVLDTFNGFLSNTLSFLRVGAFAMAHAGLSLGIFETERLIRAGGGVGRTLASAAVVVLGNVLVIALEGLVVGIQAARLEYYEFMSRFFRGTGRRYRPFRLAGSAEEGG